MKKNVMIMLILAAMVGMLSASASAERLVNTTFEQDSADPNTWTLPTGEVQYSLGGEPDPVSEVLWQDINGANYANVSFATEIVAGEQAAFMGDTDVARLNFANSTGNDSGLFTTTAMMFQHPATNGGNYTFLLGSNGSDGTGAAWKISWEIRMHNTTDSSVELQAWDGNSLTTLVTGLSEDAWYDVKIDADYDTDTYDVFYRVHGAGTWTQEATALAFVADDPCCGHDGFGGGDAFQVVDAGCASSNAMFDNISVSIPTGIPVYVDTTFEADSVGVGSWTLPGTEWQYSLGGEIDLESRVPWQDIEGATFANVAEAVAGEQVVFLNNIDVARLRFAGDTGNGTGVFTTTSIMYQHNATNTDGYQFMMGRNGPNADPCTNWGISWEVRLQNSSDIAVELMAWDGDTLETLAAGLSESTWYDVRVDADCDAKTYDVSYRVYGSDVWLSVADDFAFVVEGAGHTSPPVHENFGGGDAFQVFDAGVASGGAAMLDNIYISDFVPLACGDWGYLDADLDKDCYVNIKDIALLAQSWLACTDPLGTDCVSVW